MDAEGTAQQVIKPTYTAELPMEKIDEPSVPIRHTFNEAKLVELAESIGVVGVLQPIVVEAHGPRFQLHAGHRRYMASQRCGRDTIPAMVYPSGQIPGYAILIDENLAREDVNPSDQAIFVTRLYKDVCHEDVTLVCELTHRRRAWIEERLILMAGDQRVFEALQKGTINFTVAKELNLIRDGLLRLRYLDAALRGGCKGTLARTWRLQANQTTDREMAAGAPEPAPIAPTPQPPGSTLVCYLCGSREDIHEMEFVYMHRSCQRVLERKANVAQEPPKGVDGGHVADDVTIEGVTTHGD